MSSTSTTSDSTTLLIVDDEPSMRSALRRALRRSEFDIVTATDGASAIALLKEQSATDIAVSIVDLRMPGVGGLEVLAEIKRGSPETQVLLLTGHGSIATAVQAMRLGADDFLEKPFDPVALRNRVELARRVWAAKRNPAKVKPPDHGEVASQYLVGESEKTQAMRRLAWKMGQSDATLLIEGASGTGKEQFAKAVHHAGPRANEPFLAIDTSALNGTVIESELFGHSKGAFTGAEVTREGLLRAAGAGTVFLDEIGDLPLSAQAKLLRALQEREVRPVGCEKPAAIAARFVAATNKNLSAAVAKGEFREDLYHRLNVVSVTMPPLHEMKEDIPVLAEHFLMKYAAERPGVQGIVEEACAALCAYDWPGNIRELENAILRGLVMGTSESIRLADLPTHIMGPGTERFEQHSIGENDPKRHPCSDGTLASYERQAIIAALQQSQGNREQAAAVLNIGVATLYRKMKKYQIAGSTGRRPRQRFRRSS